MRNASLAAVLTAGLISLPAFAADEEGSKRDGWSGELEFSYLLKRGNTESDSLVSKGRGEYEGETWRHTAQYEAVNTTSENQTSGATERTAERYYATYKLDRKFDPANYVFNVVTYEKDVFSGYHYRISYALGYGRSLLDTERQELDLELGPGYRVRCLEPEDSYIHCTNHDNSAMLRMAGDYRWNITDTAVFREQASAEVSGDGSTYRAETSLTSQINDTLSLRLSHLLKHSTEVPPDTEETDQEVTVALVVSF